MARVLLHPVALRLHGAILVAACFLVVYRASLADLAARPRFQVQTKDLTILEPPRWIPRAEAQKIELPEGMGERASIFDPELVRTVAAAYARNAWVEQVHRVEKIYPNEVRVTLSLRRPVAAVWWQQRAYYLVDREAVRLPGASAEKPEVGFRLPFIDGAATPPPEPGRPWADPHVVAGAAVADRWQRSGLLKTIHMTCIDVSDAGGRWGIVLRLESLAKRILWGRVAGADATEIIEGLDEGKKIEVLANALKRGELRSFLEQRHGGTIDIRHGALRLLPR